jgi:hypothetical protein
MANNAKASGTGDDPNGAHTAEKRFALKHGEEIRDIRLSITIAPVGGAGPRPKREVVITVVLAPFAEIESGPRRTMGAMDARAHGARGETMKPEKQKKSSKQGRTGTLSLADVSAGAPIGGANDERIGPGKPKKTQRKARTGRSLPGDAVVGAPTGGQGRKRSVNP